MCNYVWNFPSVMTFDASASASARVIVLNYVWMLSCVLVDDDTKLC